MSMIKLMHNGVLSVFCCCK